MICPAPDKLDAMESKYALVIVAAKRARQIKEGARKLVESRSANPLTIALEEIAHESIVPLQIGEPEPLPTSLPPTPVLSGLVATAIDDDEPTVHDQLALLRDSEDDIDIDPSEDDVEAAEDEMTLAHDLDDMTEEDPYGIASGQMLDPDADPIAGETEDFLGDTDEE